MVSVFFYLPIKAGPVKPEKVEKEEPDTEAKDAGPVKAEEVEKEEPAKEVSILSVD